MLLDIEGTIDNISFDPEDRLFVISGNTNKYTAAHVFDSRIKSMSRYMKETKVGYITNSRANNMTLPEPLHHDATATQKANSITCLT